MATPSIVSLSPASVKTGGDVTITIQGTNFTDPMYVYFDDIKVASTYLNATTIDVESPALPTNGVITVFVENASGEKSAGFVLYAYLDPSSPNFIRDNRYFDEDASYTVYGKWQFAQTPTFLQGGGGGGGPVDAWNIAGNNTLGPAVFGTLNANNVSLKANNQDFLIFEAATNRLDIVADSVQMTADGTGSFTAETLVLDALDAVGVGSISCPLTVVGNNDSVTNAVSIRSSVTKIDNLPSAIKSHVVFFDTVTKELSYGTEGSAGNAWLTSGSNVGPALEFGTSSADGFFFTVNGLHVGEVTAAGTFDWYENVNLSGSFFVSAIASCAINAAQITGTLILTAGTGFVLPPHPQKSSFLAAEGIVYIQGNEAVELKSVTSDVTISAPSGNLTLSAPLINKKITLGTGELLINTLPSASTANQLFYEPGTGAVSYGTATSGANLFLQHVVYKTVGSHVYTPSAGMKYVHVRCIGSGGAGGGCGGTEYAGSGGGAGGYAEVYLDAAAVGASQTVTIQAPGAGVVDANGGNGGSTSFGTLCVASGGQGGFKGTEVGGGNGGLGTVGSILSRGGFGYSSVATPTSYQSGRGGSSFYGSGGPQRVVTSGSPVGNGFSGDAWGAGGSGAAVLALAPFAGGDGAVGICEIIEYIEV